MHQSCEQQVQVHRQTLWSNREDVDEAEQHARIRIYKDSHMW